MTTIARAPFVRDGSVAMPEGNESKDTHGSSKQAPARTPEEQSILDMVARSRGREYAERHAKGILAEARAIGDL